MGAFSLIVVINLLNRWMASSRRDDEVLALSEIFGEHKITKREIPDSNNYEIKVDIEPIIDEEISIFCITESSKLNSSNEESRTNIKFLPNTNLEVVLEPTYPEHEKCPEFSVNCVWLNELQLSEVSEHMQMLWDSMQSEILFSWIQYLQELVMELNLVEIDCDTSFKLTDVDKKRDLVTESATLSNSCQLFRYLKSHNEVKLREAFLKSEHECDVCGDEKTGSECVNFAPCEHVFCSSCVQDYYTISIKDGLISRLLCLSPDCESYPSQSELKRILPEDVFEMYENQQLKVALESMSDVVNCPRINCETPVIAEPDSNLALCQKCSFSFCKMCLRSYHGVEMCAVREERVAKIRESYEKGDAHTRMRLEMKYGKEQLLRYVNESRSLEWVANNSKPCPSCHIGTQKTKGCNKMWCARCGCHWCWLCNSKLRASNPYAHFSNNRTPCYQKLFDGMSNAELMAQFGGFEEEEPLVRHERPAEQPVPIVGGGDPNEPGPAAVPIVEVHIDPQALGLLDVEGNVNEGGNRPGLLQPGEGDMMALQLEQQLILDDDFGLRYNDDGLIYAELQPQN